MFVTKLHERMARQLLRLHHIDQAAYGAGEQDQMADSFAAHMDETADMSLNSMSAATGAEDGGTTVHSTGAFSSLGYTNVLEGGMHPAWGAAANETENLGDRAAGATDTPAAAAGGAVAALPGETAAPAVQVNKWGFVPGEEDTTDLDLEKNGVPNLNPAKSYIITVKCPCLKSANATAWRSPAMVVSKLQLTPSSQLLRPTQNCRASITTMPCHQGFTPSAQHDGRVLWRRPGCYGGCDLSPRLWEQ